MRSPPLLSRLSDFDISDYATRLSKLYDGIIAPYAAEEAANSKDFPFQVQRKFTPFLTHIADVFAKIVKVTRHPRLFPH